MAPWPPGADSSVFQFVRIRLYAQSDELNINVLTRASHFSKNKGLVYYPTFPTFFLT